LGNVLKLSVDLRPKQNGLMLYQQKSTHKVYQAFMSKCLDFSHKVHPNWDWKGKQYVFSFAKQTFHEICL